MADHKAFLEFKRLCVQACALALEPTKLEALRPRIAEALRKYIESLPEEQREDTVHFLGLLSCRLSELPERILEDDRLFELLVRIHGR